MQIKNDWPWDGRSNTHSFFWPACGFHTNDRLSFWFIHYYRPFYSSASFRKKHSNLWKCADVHKPAGDSCRPCPPAVKWLMLMLKPLCPVPVFMMISKLMFLSVFLFLPLTLKPKERVSSSEDYEKEALPIKLHWAKTSWQTQTRVCSSRTDLSASYNLKLSQSAFCNMYTNTSHL